MMQSSGSMATKSDEKEVLLCQSAITPAFVLEDDAAEMCSDRLLLPLKHVTTRVIRLSAYNSPPPVARQDALSVEEGVRESQSSTAKTTAARDST